MKLAELEPHISWPGERYQSLYFLCPACRKHEVGVEIWNGPSGVFEGVKLWHGEQGPDRDFDTLSITPSIACGPSEKHECAGWHGFITDGEIQ